MERKLKERCCLGHVGTDGRILLKKDLKYTAMEGVDWIVWPRAGTSYRLMNIVLNIWHSTKQREFLGWLTNRDSASRNYLLRYIFLTLSFYNDFPLMKFMLLGPSRNTEIMKACNIS